MDDTNCFTIKIFFCEVYWIHNETFLILIGDGLSKAKNNVTGLHITNYPTSVKMMFFLTFTVN